MSINITKSHLSTFSIEDCEYSQYFCSDDSTVIVDETTDEPKTIYTVDANATVYDRAGVLGYFKLDSKDCWYFEGVNSSFKLYTDVKYLIAAELKIFKYFLQINH